jgi:hypothetical protein
VDGRWCNQSDGATETHRGLVAARRHDDEGDEQAEGERA